MQFRETVAERLVGTWSQVCTDGDGPDAEARFIEVEILMGPDGLCVRDRRRIAAPASPVALEISGDSMTAALPGVFGPIRFSARWSPDYATLDATLTTGFGDVGGATSYVLRRDDPRSSAFRAPRIGHAGDVVTTYEYRSPTKGDDDWPVGEAAASGIDVAALERLITSILCEDGHPSSAQTDGLIVVRGGKLLLEETFWGHEPLRPHEISSCTKTITSFLAGLAWDRGLLDLDAPVANYFTDRPDARWVREGSTITVSHLLSMTSGTEWLDRVNPDGTRSGSSVELLSSGDVTGFVLNRPHRCEPGAEFLYDNGLPALVGILVARVFGEPLDVVAERLFFKPLGIRSARWANTPADGVLAAGGIRMSIRDLAKIGQLVLNAGSWHGQSVISEEWIRKATAQQTRPTDYPYGYYWHLTDERHDHFGGTAAHLALGQGGQVVAVVPELDLVAVVFSSNWYPPSDPSAGLNDTAATLEALPLEIVARVIEAAAQHD